MSAGRPRGRFAPSPTGEMHLGNASTALLAWLSIRSRGGRIVMRLEDLDRNRYRPEYADRLLTDLLWLGLDWDEGPDRPGPHAPYDQWSRRGAYLEALERLRVEGRVYPCFCSRRDIRAAANAPQEPQDEVRYPGTCRDLDPELAQGWITSGRRHAWRFRVDVERFPVFTDRIHGSWGSAEPVPGDFVIHRADGVPAYQLAVVVDDIAMRIDEVVRGDDLLASTGRQLLLFEAFGAEPPAFAHVPLLLGSDRVRLSKRHRGLTLRELWDSGVRAEEVVGYLAQRLGLRASDSATTARELVRGFDLGSLTSRPDGIVVEAPRTAAG